MPLQPTSQRYVLPNAQLLPIDLVAPGFRGLNLAQQGAALSPQWCTEAQNAVIDTAGRLSARRGFTNQTTTPIPATPVVRTLFEQRTAAGTNTTIVAWDGGIGTSVTDPNGSAVTGAVTASNGRWKFVNFFDKVIGFQSGQKLIVRTTGNFATVVESSGTAPTTGIGTAAYGRIWQVANDGHTINYTGLLDEANWGGGGAGNIDMAKIWTKGTDVIVAIEAFNHNLIVFGKQHIVFFSDGGSTALGMDPTKMVVTDEITGTGCVTQFSIQAVGDTDLLFLSPIGVQSLGRLLIQRNNPVATLTKYVRDDLIAHIQATTNADEITAVYSQTNGFYAVSFPTLGYVWILDQRYRYQDEQGDEVAVVTRWIATLRSMYETVSRTLYVARTAGKVAAYSSVQDEGSSFRFIYNSPWLDLGEQLSTRLKILKRITALVVASTTSNVILKWAVDFSTSFNTQSITPTAGSPAEWGLGEFGIAEWGGGAAQQVLKTPAYATGQYIRVGVECDVSSTLSLQQLELFAKIGRLT